MTPCSNSADAPASTRSSSPWTTDAATSPYSTISTRMLDVSASLFVLLVTWPVMALAALAIKTEDGYSAPALYKQMRVGQFGRHFEILKFRSMRVDAESGGAPQWAAKGRS